jgi:hypothetical protein
MENHPIPQDVTGFQFKLIGNMTVKQFAYLATGVIFAWALLQLPANILITFPFSALFALLGIGLAYVPVGGRPMDLMIGNYIKALFRPTQFIYEKTGGQIYFPSKIQPTTSKNVRQYENVQSPLPKDKLETYLESLDTKPKNKVDEVENNLLKSIADLSADSLPNTIDVNPDSNIPHDAPQIDPVKNSTPQGGPSEIAPITKLQAPIKPQISKPPIATKPSTTASVAKPTPSPTPSTKPHEQQQSILSGQIKLTKPTATRVNNPMNTQGSPEFPNLVTGIINDARGNALPNILIEVRDKDNNPVRAFKTNEFGRFASATPLANGTYTIEFEDPKGQNKFEKKLINLTGKIVLPIEAISVDTREELRRSLFATNTTTN